MQVISINDDVSRLDHRLLRAAELLMKSTHGGIWNERQRPLIDELSAFLVEAAGEAFTLLPQPSRQRWGLGRIKS